MADSTPKSYHTDPQLYLYTSLTSGSSHIVSATSRLETILKANKIPFQALDVATDEKARMLWGRRAGKRKLPGLVRMGMIVGDLEEVEEWNEYGELKDNVGVPAPAAASKSTPTPSAANTPSKPPPASINTPSKPPPASVDTPSSVPAKRADIPSHSPPKAEDTMATAMRQAGFEAAKKAVDAKTKARTEALEVSKDKSADLQKLDNSGPTGMPPPSGTTEAGEAVKPESGKTSVAGKADEVPSAEKEGEATEGQRNATAEDLTGPASEHTKGETPSAKEAEESANKSTAANESEILEGKGQAEPQDVPTAKEIEAEANKAIAADESKHVHIAGEKGKGQAATCLEEAKSEKRKSQEGKSKAEAMNRTVKQEKGEGHGEPSSVENKAKRGKAEAALKEEELQIEKGETAEDLKKEVETDTAQPATEAEEAKETTREPEKARTEATEEEPNSPPKAEEKNHDDEKTMPKRNEKEAGVEPPEVNAATDKAQDLPGTKTQDQRAADANKAGESVAD